MGIFPWLLVQHQLHHQRRITHIPPRPERILQAACSLPKHHFFQLALKNVVTLYTWQNREPGRLVGLPYIIGDLTNIFSSVRLCHIVQCQHFSIGTIYPRVLEQTNNTGEQGHCCPEWTPICLWSHHQHVTRIFHILNIEGFGGFVIVGGFFPFWLLLFGFRTSAASHEELENSSVGGKGIHLGRYCMGQAGTEPVRVLAMPPSLESFIFPGQACSKLAGMTVPIHCSKPDISAGSASRQPSPPASFWQQLPCFFEIKRLKKHERNGVDCPRCVLDAFYLYKHLNDVL